MSKQQGWTINIPIDGGKILQMYVTQEDLVSFGKNIRVIDPVNDAQFSELLKALDEGGLIPIAPGGAAYIECSDLPTH